MIHDQSYKSAFNRIMMHDPCRVLVKAENPRYTWKMNLCKTIMDKAVTKGMTVGIARHLENMKYIEQTFWYYTENPDHDFIHPKTGNIQHMNVTEDKQKDNFLNILNLPEVEDINLFQQEIVHPAIIYLQHAFKISFSNFYITSMTRRLLLYIGFNVVLFVIYLLIWQPFLVQLNAQLWKTRSMLQIIPMRVMANIKSIKTYLMDLAADEMRRAGQNIL